MASTGITLLLHWTGARHQQAAFSHRRPMTAQQQLDSFEFMLEGAMDRLKRQMAATHVFKMMDSPLGRLTLVASNDGLAAILWPNDSPGRVPLHLEGERDDHPILVETARQLGDYFAGRRKVFTVKLDVAGTAFQRQVWGALLEIPFGETRSYRQIAERIGHPAAMRAVGAANGRNPVSIVTPCHRVIGSGGALTGFAGGLDAKAYLLALERADA
jgi:methylated-DNA-[protein]-cysteine S-methyltransferase